MFEHAFPPMSSPSGPVSRYMFVQGTSWRDDEVNVPVVIIEPALGLGKISEQKGILGPGPADLRFPEAL